MKTRRFGESAENHPMANAYGTRTESGSYMYAYNRTEHVTSSYRNEVVAPWLQRVNREAFFTEAARVLRPSGLFLLVALEYSQVYADFLENGSVIWYHAHDDVNTKLAAEHVGLQLIHSGFWEQPPHEEDWYIPEKRQSAVQRRVYVFQSPSRFRKRLARLF